MKNLVYGKHLLYGRFRAISKFILEPNNLQYGSKRLRTEVVLHFRGLIKVAFYTSFAESLLLCEVSFLLPIPTLFGFLPILKGYRGQSVAGHNLTSFGTSQTQSRHFSRIAFNGVIIVCSPFRNTHGTRTSGGRGAQKKCAPIV